MSALQLGRPTVGKQHLDMPSSCFSLSVRHHQYTRFESTGWLTYSDTPLALDPVGIELINEQARLGIQLVHDDHFTPKIIHYGDIAEPIDQELRQLLLSPQQFPDQLSSSLTEVDQQQIAKLEEYAENENITKFTLYI